MTINQCSRCGLEGYEYTDPDRLLCHNCVTREIANRPIILELQAILDRHLEEFHKRWFGCEHGKAMIGNAICDAIRQYGGEPQFTKWSGRPSPRQPLPFYITRTPH